MICNLGDPMKKTEFVANFVRYLTKDLYQVLRGGSCYTRFLMREHSRHETPTEGGVFFRSKSTQFQKIHRVCRVVTQFTSLHNSTEFWHPAQIRTPYTNDTDTLHAIWHPTQMTQFFVHPTLHKWHTCTQFGHPAQIRTPYTNDTDTLHAIAHPTQMTHFFWPPIKMTDFFLHPTQMTHIYTMLTSCTNSDTLHKGLMATRIIHRLRRVVTKLTILTPYTNSDTLRKWLMATRKIHRLGREHRVVRLFGRKR